MGEELSTQKDFNVLLKLIQEARQKTYLKINTTLIGLYWQISKNISEKVKSEKWGKKRCKRACKIYPPE